MKKNKNLYENDKWIFIWGVKAEDDLHFGDSNLFTLNDIEIFFNKNEKKYYLGVETVYLFNNTIDQCFYFENLLKKFEEYMIKNSKSLTSNYKYIEEIEKNKYPQFIANDISELFEIFKIYVQNQKFLVN